MAISLINIIAEGGCYWKRQLGSPGHSLGIPSGTPFKIATDGPLSQRFVAGVCKAGYFEITEGKYSGTRFASANAAVNTIREPSSNAFLYVQFNLDGIWILADDLRRSETFQFDDAEETALDRALRAVRSHPKVASLDDPQMARAAARHVAKNPQMIEFAREHLKWMSAIQA